jgi:hypothetical protein
MKVETLFSKGVFLMNSSNEKKEDKGENLFFKRFVYRVWINVL